MKLMYKKIIFKIHNEKNGSLIALEDFELPFKPKRIFYIFNAKEDRGNHIPSAREIIICLNGYVDLILNKNDNEEKIHLNNPQEGYFINKNVKISLKNFSKDCILLVLNDINYKDCIYS